MPVRKIRYFYVCVYSTVTDLARLRGWSTSFPLHTAIWYANNCNGMVVTKGSRHSNVSGISMHSSAILRITVSCLLINAIMCPFRAFISWTLLRDTQ